MWDNDPMGGDEDDDDGDGGPGYVPVWHAAAGGGGGGGGGRGSFGGTGVRGVPVLTHAEGRRFWKHRVAGTPGPLCVQS